MKRPRLLESDERPRAPRQRRSLDARDRLTAAALRLFSGKGYERTSIDEVARRAGVAVGGVYLHFRSKRHLLLALMDDFLERLSEVDARTRAADPRTAIHDVLARAFAADRTYAGVYRAWREAVLVDPDLARHERRIRQWTTTRVIAFLTQMRTFPGARDDVDVARLGRVLDSFFWSLIAEYATGSAPHLEAQLEATSAMIFHALFKDPPANERARQSRPRTRAAGRR